MMFLHVLLFAILSKIPVSLAAISLEDMHRNYGWSADYAHSIRSLPSQLPSSPQASLAPFDSLLRQTPVSLGSSGFEILDRRVALLENVQAARASGWIGPSQYNTAIRMLTALDDLRVLPEVYRHLGAANTARYHIDAVIESTLRLRNLNAAAGWRAVTARDLLELSRITHHIRDGEALNRATTHLLRAADTARLTPDQVRGLVSEIARGATQLNPPVNPRQPHSSPEATQQMRLQRFIEGYTRHLAEFHNAQQELRLRFRNTGSAPSNAQLLAVHNRFGQFPEMAHETFRNPGQPRATTGNPNSMQTTVNLPQELHQMLQRSFPANTPEGQALRASPLAGGREGVRPFLQGGGPRVATAQPVQMIEPGGVRVIEVYGQRIGVEAGSAQDARSAAPTQWQRPSVFSGAGAKQLSLGVGIGAAAIIGISVADCVATGNNPRCWDELAETLSPVENPGLWAGLAVFVGVNFGLNNVFTDMQPRRLAQHRGWQLIRQSAALTMGMGAMNMTMDVVNMAVLCRRALQNPEDRDLKSRCENHWERLVVSDKIVELMPQAVSAIAGLAVWQGVTAARGIPVVGRILTRVVGNGGVWTIMVQMGVFFGTYYVVDSAIQRPYAELTQGIYSLEESVFQNSLWEGFSHLVGSVTASPLRWLFGVESRSSIAGARESAERYLDARAAEHAGRLPFWRTLLTTGSWFRAQQVWDHTANHETLRRHEQQASLVPRLAFRQFQTALREWVQSGFDYRTEHSCVENLTFEVPGENGETHRLPRFCARPLRVDQTLRAFTQSRDLWRSHRQAPVLQMLQNWTKALSETEQMLLAIRFTYPILAVEAARIAALPAGAPRQVLLTPERLKAAAQRAGLGNPDAASPGHLRAIGQARAATILESLVMSAACGPWVLPPNRYETYLNNYPLIRMSQGASPDVYPPALVRARSREQTICHGNLQGSSDGSNVFSELWSDTRARGQMHTSLLDYVVLNMAEEILNNPAVPFPAERTTPQENQALHAMRSFDRWYNERIHRFFFPVAGAPPRTFWMDQALEYRNLIRNQLVPVITSPHMSYCLTERSSFGFWNRSTLSASSPECALAPSGLSLTQPQWTGDRLGWGLAQNLRDELHVLRGALRAIAERALVQFPAASAEGRTAPLDMEFFNRLELATDRTLDRLMESWTQTRPQENTPEWGASFESQVRHLAANINAYRAFFGFPAVDPSATPENRPARALRAQNLRREEAPASAQAAQDPLQDLLSFPFRDVSVAVSESGEALHEPEKRRLAMQIVTAQILVRMMEISLQMNSLRIAMRASNASMAELPPTDLRNQDGDPRLPHSTLGALGAFGRRLLGWDELRSEQSPEE